MRFFIISLWTLSLTHALKAPQTRLVSTSIHPHIMLSAILRPTSDITTSDNKIHEHHALSPRCNSPKLVLVTGKRDTNGKAGGRRTKTRKGKKSVRSLKIEKAADNHLSLDKRATHTCEPETMKSGLWYPNDILKAFGIHRDYIGIFVYTPFTYVSNSKIIINTSNSGLAYEYKYILTPLNIGVINCSHFKSSSGRKNGVSS